MENQIILNENINPIAIKWLLQQENIHTTKDEEYKNILRSLLKSYKLNKKFKITYKTSKKYENYGRIYGFHNPTKSRFMYGSLGSLPRDIRGFLADADNLDIDIKKCHWYIIKYFIEKSDDFSNNLINKFLLKYDDIVKFIIENKDKFIEENDYQSYHTESDKAKDLIFSVLYTQPSYLSNKKQLFLDNCPLFNKLYLQIYNSILPILKENHKELIEIVNKDFKKSEKNSNGKILSHILQDIEKNLIIDIVNYFSNKKFKISSIIHDGFIMYKCKEFSEEILRDCEEYIKTKWGSSMNITLVIKPFLTGVFPEIPDGWTGDEDIEKTDYAMLCDNIIEYVSEKKLRKDQNENIYKQSIINPMHYELSYKTNETGYANLLEEIFENDIVFNSSPAFYTHMYNFLQIRNRKEFLNIKFDKELIGFNNCVLNLKTLELINICDIDPDENRIVRHFIYNSLNVNELKVEKFEEIINYQLDNEKALEWLYIFIGRLFFKPDNDTLQSCLFIKGTCNTGKSLVGNILSAMFRYDSIGTIQSTQEQTFGFETFIDRDILIAFDLPEDIKNVIPVDLFKGMASGETINVPRKNKKAITIKWEVPSTLISNYYPNYEDKGGAISKRLAIFEFMKSIKNPDSSIQDYIIKNELPSIIYKSCKIYKEFLDKKINKTFHDIRPEYFIMTNEEYLRNNNNLYQYLTSPDSEDKQGNIYTIEFNENYETNFSEIQNKFKNWCKFNNIKNNKISSDDSTFTQMGLEKKVIALCKSCNNKHNKNCCDNYKRENKTTKLMIKGIRFYKIDIDDNITDDL